MGFSDERESDTIRDLAISKANAKSSIPVIVTLSAAIALCVSGLGLILLLYLFALHSTWVQGTALVSTARLQFITAITQALSTCVARAIPVIVSVYAYALAAEWLKLSELPDSPERPTALHLGLLMTVLQGAGIFSWISTTTKVKYLRRSYKGSVHSVPRILQKSIWVIGSLLLLSYLASAFDTWLHVSSTAEFMRFEETYVSENIFFGKQVNKTRCAYYGALYNTSYLSPVCGLFLPGLGGSDTSASATEATLTMGNASTSNFVQLTDDQHAILVPAVIPSRIAYNASTIGVKSQCRSLTRQCLDASAMNGSFPSFHCPGSPPVIVNNTFFDMFSTLNGMVFGVRNETGGIAYTSADQYSFQAVTTNPFPFVTIQLSQMFDIANQSQSQFVGDSGFFYTSSRLGTAYNLLTCDVSVREVTYEYRDASQGDSSNPVPTFTTQSYSISDLLTAQRLATLLDTSFVDAAVSARSLDAAIESGSGFEDAYAWALSTSMVAASASIFEASPAIHVISLKPLLISRIQLAPLVGFGIMITAFCLWIVGLAVKASISTRLTALSHLGQIRLTSPQASLHHLLASIDSEATWDSNSANLFQRERENDGLMIGNYESPSGEPTFGIGRASDIQLLDSSKTLSSSQSPLESSLARPSVAFQKEASRNQAGHPPLSLVFATAGILILILSLVVFLLVYLLSANQHVRSGGLLQTTASLPYLLAVSQAICTLMTLAVAPVMGLHAFRVASVWANSTRAFEAPLPSELCRLSYMIQGASLWTFVRQYHLKASRARSGVRPRGSRLVSEAAWVLGCLLALSNLAVVADNWFHISTSSFPTTLSSQQMHSDQTMFGRQIDFSRCSQYAAAAPTANLTAIRHLCGILTDEGVVSPSAISESQQTWSNRSTTNRIAMTQDQHAILVPANLPDTLRYEAATVGVKTTCTSITRRCVDPASKQTQEQWRTVFHPWFNCTGSPPINIDNNKIVRAEHPGWVSLLGILNQTSGDIVDGITSRAYEVAESSPLQMVMGTHTAFGREPGLTTSYIADDGFTYSPNAGGGWQLYQCTVAINEVQYQYDGSNSTFNTLSATSASSQIVKMVMASTDNFEFTDVVSTVVSVLYSGGEYSAAYEREFSSILLSDAVLAFTASDAQSVWRITPALGSQVQILPLAIFLVLTGLFCGNIVLILIRTASHWNASPIARMAHDRLMSPLPIIMQLFGSMEAMKLPEDSDARRRLEELDENRLNIGPLQTRDGHMFTVYKLTHEMTHYGAPEPSTAFCNTEISVRPPSAASTLGFDGDTDCNSVNTFHLPAIEPDVPRRRSPRQITFSSRSTLVDHLTADWS